MTTIITDQIRELGGADARYSQRDHGVISATVYDADDIKVGIISITRRQVNSEISRGLLSHTVLHDNARDPRYQWRIEVIRLTEGRPGRRYNYLTDYQPMDRAMERNALSTARRLGLRLTWGVGGGENRLHEDDWPVLREALN